VSPGAPRDSRLTTTFLLLRAFSVSMFELAPHADPATRGAAHPGLALPVLFNTRKSDACDVSAHRGSDSRARSRSAESERAPAPPPALQLRWLCEVNRLSDVPADASPRPAQPSPARVRVELCGLTLQFFPDASWLQDLAAFFHAVPHAPADPQIPAVLPDPTPPPRISVSLFDLAVDHNPPYRASRAVLLVERVTVTVAPQRALPAPARGVGPCAGTRVSLTINNAVGLLSCLSQKSAFRARGDGTAGDPFDAPEVGSWRDEGCLHLGTLDLAEPPRARGAGADGARDVEVGERCHHRINSTIVRARDALLARCRPSRRGFSRARCARTSCSPRASRAFCGCRSAARNPAVCLSPVACRLSPVACRLSVRTVCGVALTARARGPPFVC
jgi:hypothetical protein